MLPRFCTAKPGHAAVGVGEADVQVVERSAGADADQAATFEDGGGADIGGVDVFGHRPRRAGQHVRGRGHRRILTARGAAGTGAGNGRDHIVGRRPSAERVGVGGAEGIRARWSGGRAGLRLRPDARTGCRASARRRRRRSRLGYRRCATHPGAVSSGRDHRG